MGAAIAAGNHLENGTWALLVQAANIILVIISAPPSEAHRLTIDQLLFLVSQAILNRIRASPIRLVSAVIIPALKDFGFE